jgi:hypothetical protein
MARHPVTLTRGDALRAWAAGARAGSDPATMPTVCPFSAAGDADERVRVAAWLRGFLHIRSLAA